MKRFLCNNHDKIDRISLAIFLYCILVIIFLNVFALFLDEYIQAVCAVVLPLFIVNSYTVEKINLCMHKLFGFSR